MTIAAAQVKTDDSDYLEILPDFFAGEKMRHELIDGAGSSLCKRIRIGGLNQPLFDYFVENFGQRFREISFWKCPLVSDLRKLEILHDVENISFFWNQRAEHLWDLSNNPRLTHLSFDDFTRMNKLTDVVRAPSLTSLHFGNVVWAKFVLESLQPLTDMPKLKELTFNAKAIQDNRIEPLSHLPELKELEFRAGLFSMEKIAWLKARIPQIASSSVAPYRQIDCGLVRDSARIDILVNGKRGAFLSSAADSKRLAKLTQRFDGLVERFRDNPQISEPD
jgi:hypothetical protein